MTSACLQKGLEASLRRLLPVSNVPEYSLRWKHWDMPSGLPICALRASGRRTSDSGCFGWQMVAKLAGWSSPRAEERCQHNSRDNGAALSNQVAGLTASSSPAGGPTARSGIAGSGLNPAMSRWLMGFPQNGRTPGWDTCSPGWESWALIQRLLGEYCARPGATGSGS